MFPEEIQNYITRGHEEVDIEYKASMTWQNRETRLKILCAMLALSNHQDGGVIVIGVRDGDCEPIGMNDEDYASFKYDDIARVVKNHAEPFIEFKLLADTLEISGATRKFVVIQIREATELSTICTKLELWNTSAPSYNQNIALRQNAIYIRSKAPIESREIASVHEWKELIYRTIEKSERTLFKRLPSWMFESQNKEKSDTDKYNEDLKTDGLYE